MPGFQEMEVLVWASCGTPVSLSNVEPRGMFSFRMGFLCPSGSGSDKKIRGSRTWPWGVCGFLFWPMLFCSVYSTCWLRSPRPSWPLFPTILIWLSEPLSGTSMPPPEPLGWGRGRTDWGSRQEKRDQGSAQVKSKRP